MNMAIDELLLEDAASSGRATLRFYGWQPATLSLGYFQKINERQAHEASLSCEVVRRASGGGAIMHDHDLTYSFSVPTTSRWGDTQQMYFAFHETLVDVLSDYGVVAELHSEKKGLSSDQFLCFLRRASGDVTADGHKIMGSAQRRAKNAVLQHGSLLLAKSVHAPELPGLKEITGQKVETSQLVEKWLRRLTSRLKVNFSSSELTDTEKRGAIRLRDTKFARDSWVQRR